ncbi:MAG: lysophospholipid acyltransferase family protein [Candidatus Omnitrophota bacterium]
MWYWVFRYFFYIGAKLLFRLKTEGLENIPQKTNFIIVANHNSYLDAGLIMAAVPKKVYCIALRFLYKVFLIGWFLKKIEALPVGSASRKAIYLLENNKNVGLFPEGGVSPDGKMREFKRGAALLALKTGRPIVPCAVLGSFEALPLSKFFPKLVPIKLKIGKPVYLLKEFDEVIDDIYLQQGIFKIRNNIKEMLDAG